MDNPHLRSLLSGLPLGGLRYFDRVSSTNEAAMMWLDQGAREYSLVVADEQTAGRGRFNRRWVTRPGAALAFSLIVRPSPAEAAYLTTFSPWGALAVAQALEDHLGLRPLIKWPNDVLLSGRKISGILVEGNLDRGPAGRGDPRDRDQRDRGCGSPARGGAVSRRQPGGSCRAPVDRWQLLRNILAALFAWRPLLGTAAFYQAWEERLAFRGEQVTIKAGDESAPDLHGQVIGISPDGSLRLRAGGSRTWVRDNRAGWRRPSPPRGDLDGVK